MALGFVIAVHIFQGCIQFKGEQAYILRFFIKFNQPFMATVSMFRKVDGCSGIVVEGCAGFFAGYGNGFVAVVNNQLLAKCINKVFYPAAHFNLKRRTGRKLHCIAHEVAP